MDELIEVIKILKKPYIHLVIDQKDEFNKLLNKFAEVSEDEDEIFHSIIEGENCRNVMDLFKEFAIKLNFPNYFGENWAAFDECLNDLEWLNSNKFVLFIKDFDKILLMDNEGYNVFVSILFSTVNEWISGRNFDSFPTSPTPFHLVIQCNKENIGKLESSFSKVGFSDLHRVIL